MRRTLLAAFVVAVSVVVPARAEDLDGGECHQTRGPSVTHTWVLVATAVARKAGDVALTTSVSCTLTDADGETLVVEGTSLGPVAVASGARPMAVSPLVSKCVTATVQYLTTGVTTETDCTYY